MLIITALYNKAHRSTERFDTGYPLLQCLCRLRRHPDHGMHIIKIFIVAVHRIFDVQTRRNRRVQLFIILPGIAYIPHSGAVQHCSLRNFGQNLLAGLPVHIKIQIHSLAGLNKRCQPAITYDRFISIPGNIQKGVIGTIHHDVISVASVHNGRCNQIGNGDSSAQEILFRRCFPYRGFLFRFCSAWLFLSAESLLFSFSPCFLFRHMHDGADVPRICFCCSRKRLGVYSSNLFCTCVRGCRRKGILCCRNTFCIPHILVCRKRILLHIFKQDSGQGSCGIKGRQRQRIFLTGTRVQKLIQNL